MRAASGGISLRIDGKWGEMTNRAWLGLTDEIRDSITAYLASIGFSLNDIRGGIEMEPEDEGSARAIIERIAAEEGVPTRLAIKVAKLESKFRPNAVSPTGFKGLYQLGTPAMTDVRNSDPSGVQWEPAGSNRYGKLYRMVKPFDPEQNSRVGQRYLQLLANGMDLDIEDENSWPALYMAFNIGRAGAKAVLAGTPEKVAPLIAANPAYGRGDVLAYYPALTRAVQLA